MGCNKDEEAYWVYDETREYDSLTSELRGEMLQVLSGFDERIRDLEVLIGSGTVAVAGANATFHKLNDYDFSRIRDHVGEEMGETAEED